MVKEIERVGIPVVHMCTITPISLTVGANRIIPTIAIPHPLGNPTLTKEDEYALRYKLVDAARAITDDLQARYDAYTVAEAFLIDNALVIPYGYDNGGYTASRLNPFESQFAPFGISNERYKGQKLLDAPMSTDQYWDAYDLWQEERAKLAEAAE
mgnify:CR=1 FL=1